MYGQRFRSWTMVAIVGVCLGLMPRAVEAATASVTYCVGWVWDTWDITGGPANNDYTFQHQIPGSGVWSTVAGGSNGTTDGAGADSDYNIRWGPNDGAISGRPIRACFAGTPVLYCPADPWEASTTDNANVAGDFSDVVQTLPSTLLNQSWELSQNAQVFLDMGLSAFLVAGSNVHLTLPSGFTWAGTPTVTSTDAGDLTLGPAGVLPGNETLVIPVAGNLGNNLFAGISITGADINYDGTAGGGLQRMDMQAVFAPHPSLGLATQDVYSNFLAFQAVPVPAALPAGIGLLALAGMGRWLRRR